MLEKPNIQDQVIAGRLSAEFELQVAQLTFLPLGADINSAVYRVVSNEGLAYFLKLRRGDFEEITITVPQFLKAQGIQEIMAPLETKKRGLYTTLDGFAMILYPFIDGENGYQVSLSDQQWVTFGTAFRSIHTARIPPTLARHIPRETYTPQWREIVKAFQAQVERKVYADPISAKLAAFLREERNKISVMVERADILAGALKQRAMEFVLCHADIHAGNLLICPDGDIYIVDWDNPIFAPKEKDLMFIGEGMGGFRDTDREKKLFYQGYGRTSIDPTAMAYYRYERIIEDIAAFCEEIFYTIEGAEDREQAYEYLTSSFLPGRTFDIACETDTQEL